MQQKNTPPHDDFITDENDQTTFNHDDHHQSENEEENKPQMREPIGVEKANRNSLNFFWFFTIAKLFLTQKN